MVLCAASFSGELVAQKEKRSFIKRGDPSSYVNISSLQSSKQCINNGSKTGLAIPRFPFRTKHFSGMLFNLTKAYRFSSDDMKQLPHAVSSHRHLLCCPM